MISKELVVLNASGIHARPAAMIVETAGKFQGSITFIKDGFRANAKSIMNIMMLAAEPGAVIEVECEGDDEVAAMAAMEDLFIKGFGNE